MEVAAALSELCDLLPGLNYVVSLDLHRIPLIPDGTPKQYVAAALGPKAVFGGAVKASAAEILNTVDECLRWKGDDGSHPDEDAIHSPRLDELVTCVLSHLEHEAAASHALWRFWLLSGHPHYPVQWSFAYLIEGPREVQLFIGSSSD